MGINREILRLAGPSILANITVPLVGMVDIAVVGHLGGDAGAAALIGGIAIGTMLFDLLYWNFGFLRVSTGGMTAQAYGAWKAGNQAAARECAHTLVRSIGVALASSVFLLLIQWIFVKAAFLVVDCTPEVRSLACRYFFIRIWAAPATLSLMAFKGWFIGMQNSVAAMTTDLVVNAVNIVSSIILAVGFVPFGGTWKGLGYDGVAIGTVTAQYSGLLCALVFVLAKYSALFGRSARGSFSRVFAGSATRKFFSMNGDIFVRSLCFIAIYIGYTVISARYGDTLLASCSIMMKLLMIFSYFTDGFAYAAEAMTGKYIGSADQPGLRATVKWCFVWTAGLSVAFMFIYGFGGVPLLRLMTSDPVVISTARRFLPWLLLMPVAGCAAFTWDGVYIGATASRQVRNAMLWATLAFFLVWFGGIWFFNPGTSILPTSVSAFTPTNESAIHLLMAAYFAHLLARTVYLTLVYPHRDPLASFTSR